MLFKAHPFTMMLKRSATRFPHRQTAIPNIRKSPTNLNHITSVKLEERRLSFPRQPAFSFFIHSVRANRGHRGSRPCQAGFAQSNPLLVRPIPLCSLTAVRSSAFSALPFLIRFDRHRNCKNLIINLHKSFRALILFGVALQLFLAQTLEVLRTAIAHKKVPATIS